MKAKVLSWVYVPTAPISSHCEIQISEIHPKNQIHGLGKQIQSQARCGEAASSRLELALVGWDPSQSLLSLPLPLTHQGGCCS